MDKKQFKKQFIETTTQVTCALIESMSMGKTGSMISEIESDFIVKRAIKITKLINQEVNKTIKTIKQNN